MMILFFLACALETDSAPEIPATCETAPEVSWENWGEGFFLTYCNSCHSQVSENRNGAPEDVNFNTYSEVKHWKERIHVRVLEEGTMPLGGGVYPEDLEMLEVFLACMQ